MKECKQCGLNKPFGDFYSQKGNSDGLFGKCKECTKENVRRNRRENIGYYRDYEKRRFQEQPHRREAAREYQKTEISRVSMEISRRMWAEKNPEKRAAHVLLGNAVRDGRVVKPKKCSRCGKEPERSRHLHAHHDDYARPLDVEWVCIWCHAAEHWPNEYRK